jgi:hypothetical protein
MWHVWVKREMNEEFWWGNLKGKDHLENYKLDDRKY